MAEPAITGYQKQLLAGYPVIHKLVYNNTRNKQQYNCNGSVK
jgi:hypothetical protein